MKHSFIIFAFSVIALTIGGSYKSVALASQSEGAMPKSGDLCGGTGGNGQIVNVRYNEFTIKRNDDGRNQIIHLASHTTIETSSGNVPISNLKNGERVTLVGGPNPDGSFTADTVVLCSGTQKKVTAQEVQLRQKQTGNVKKANVWISFIDTSTILLGSLIWLSTVLFLRFKKKKSLVYLLFFTIFSIYLYKVLDYTLLQFQPLLLLKHFVPDLMLRGDTVEQGLNLIPLVTLRLVDVRTSFLNILLMLPFGFGLPFVTNYHMKKVVVSGMFLSITIEFLQFITGFLSNMTFRVADVNDVIFNTFGAAIGYMLFVGFIRKLRHTFHNRRVLQNSILRYIAERPQVNKQ